MLSILFFLNFAAPGQIVAGDEAPLRWPLCEGPTTLELIVDGSELGLRLNPSLPTAAKEAFWDDQPNLEWVPHQDFSGNATLYAKTGFLTPAAAADLCAQLRADERVWSASPRLWAEEDPRFLTEEILVRWRPDTTQRQRESATLGWTPTATLGFSTNPGQVFRPPHGSNQLKLSNALAQSGLVEWATPDFQLRRMPASDPNDPLYSEQWHLESTGQNGALVDADIDASEAWDTTLGDASVRIAVIDTGVELQHPDLIHRLVQGLDVLDNDNNPQAEDFLFGIVTENHSTSVCGLIGAEGDNQEGVTGVAQQCSIIPIRFLSEWVFSQPTLQDEVDAFLFALQADASVVNNSWGPTGAAPLPAATKAAMDDLNKNGRNGLGSLIFFAAGNSANNNSSNGYASYGGVLGISACTDQELLASYSCFGPSIDLCAPSNGGINQLTTTDRLGGKGYSSGSYTNMFGGTSGASPIAAGVAALVYAANPDLSRWEAMVALLSTAQKIDAVGGQYDNKGHSPKYGYGRVDAAQAVRLATRIDSISISGSAIGQVGGTVDIHLQAGPANGMWSLFYSRTLAGNQGPGGTLAPGLIHPLDLGGRPAYAATGSFDAQGNASWTSIPLPSNLAGTTVYVEAVGTDSSGLRYDSAAHEVVVQ